ncbi:hypothetical protein [Gilliamella sp. wkB178]|uniref:hypothetical protein n=1 Tax=Gilliamella sp. wkB178 TaxID=3120259 RepID=UPI00159ED1D2|nr:hypothetical protein [Gilliamella apicola]
MDTRHYRTQTITNINLFFIRKRIPLRKHLNKHKNASGGAGIGWYGVLWRCRS